MDEEEQELKTDDSFDIFEESPFDFLVISENNAFIVVWRMIYLVSCLTSSYFYIWLASFEP
jgi:hypothetical protein